MLPQKDNELVVDERESLKINLFLSLKFWNSGTNRHEPICCRAAALSVADVAPVYLKRPSIGSRAAHCLFSASAAREESTEELHILDPETIAS